MGARSTVTWRSTTRSRTHGVSVTLHDRAGASGAMLTLHSAGACLHTQSSAGRAAQWTPRVESAGASSVERDRDGHACWPEDAQRDIVAGLACDVDKVNLHRAKADHSTKVASNPPPEPRKRRARARREGRAGRAHTWRIMSPSATPAAAAGPVGEVFVTTTRPPCWPIFAPMPQTPPVTASTELRRGSRFRAPAVPGPSSLRALMLRRNPSRTPSIAVTFARVPRERNTWTLEKSLPQVCAIFHPPS